MTGRFDLFGPVQTKPRRAMMHASDVGEAPGLMPGWATATGGYFQCSKCGHDAGWLFNMQISEIRRGLPCPRCNASEEKQ